MDIIWITLINHGYIEYTRNFLKALEVNRVENFRLIIYCINEETIEELRENRYCECVNANVFLDKKEYTDKFTVFQTEEYKRIVFAKLDAIKYTLENNKEKMVGYIDMDIVLFRNPTEVIMEEMIKYPEYDVYSQCDENKICRDKFNCRKICSGLCVFKNKEEMYECFNYREEDLKEFIGDQDVLLYNLNKHNMRHITIDKNVFINGGYKYIFRKEIQVEFPKNKCAVHFNFIAGNEKIHRMKVQKMWYI